MAVRIDLTGQTFGRLTVVAPAESSGKGQARWRCLCTCGGATVSWGSSLRRGRATSCGCGQREAVAALLTARNAKPDDQITYGGAHLRVRGVRGRAAEYPCVDCGQLAAHWSLRHQAPVTRLGPSPKGSICRFSADPSDYEPRCAKCHKAYDRME